MGAAGTHGICVSDSRAADAFLSKMNTALLNGATAIMRKEIVFYSVVKCPSCGHEVEFRMSRYSSTSAFDCPRCKTRSVSRADDCCIYCLHGSVKCPAKQRSELST
jgi:ssDNA-binding Zn-finger/Zn-ribbon topoisomerase 1